MREPISCRTYENLVSFLIFIEQSKIERIPPFSKGGSIIFIYGVIEFKKDTKSRPMAGKKK